MDIFDWGRPLRQVQTCESRDVCILGIYITVIVLSLLLKKINIDCFHYLYNWLNKKEPRGLVTTKSGQWVVLGWNLSCSIDCFFMGLTSHRFHFVTFLFREFPFSSSMPGLVYVCLLFMEIGLWPPDSIWYFQAWRLGFSNFSYGIFLVT